MRACLLDDRTKFREVRDALDVVADASLRVRLEALFRRGVFRHGHDVAYAKILMLRELKSDDEVATEVAEGYVGMGCDPVYPQ